MSGLGKQAEELAVRTLLELGYRIRAVNYHSLYGEVDVIADDGATVCFVEVRCREAGAMVGPEESVTPLKQRKIIMTSLLYLQETGCELQPRFDVFAVTARNGEVAGYKHWKGAFDGEAYQGH